MNLVPRPFTGDAESYLKTTSDLLASHEPRVRAFTHIDRRLLNHPSREIDGPLAGMPIAIKEIIDVAGMPTTFGSALFADRIPEHDAESVARLRSAGALILGMTTTTPFACGTTTETDNPAAPGHTPGGSSAGSGAAVGAGFVPAALGSQSQASTLRPAAYCGAWGLKPSHGRLPTGGMHALADILDDLGIIAAGLTDLRSVFDVLASPRSDRPARRTSALRVGRLHLDDGGLPDRATVAELDRVVERIGRYTVVEAGTPDLIAMDEQLAGSGLICFDLFAGESAFTLSAHVEAGEPDPRLRELVDHAAALGADGLRAARSERDRLRARWAALSEHVDVIITLATTDQAPFGHETTGCRRMPATSSLLGVPAITAPWATVDGRPQGIQLLGFEGADEELLDAAAFLHDMLDDPDRAPAPELEKS